VEVKSQHVEETGQPVEEQAQHVEEKQSLARPSTYEKAGVQDGASTGPQVFQNAPDFLLMN
jgi:hypothetical protein